MQSMLRLCVNEPILTSTRDLLFDSVIRRAICRSIIVPQKCLSSKVSIVGNKIISRDEWETGSSPGYGNFSQFAGGTCWRAFSKMSNAHAMWNNMRIFLLLSQLLLMLRVLKEQQNSPDMTVDEQCIKRNNEREQDIKEKKQNCGIQEFERPAKF